MTSLHEIYKKINTGLIGKWSGRDQISGLLKSWSLGQGWGILAMFFKKKLNVRSVGIEYMTSQNDNSIKDSWEKWKEK